MKRWLADLQIFSYASRFTLLCRWLVVYCDENRFALMSSFILDGAEILNIHQVTAYLFLQDNQVIKMKPCRSPNSNPCFLIF
jgi:hypothetical protein